MFLRLALTALLLGAVAGCRGEGRTPLPPPVRPVLEGSRRLEVLALDPFRISAADVAAGVVEQVHGYQVLARADVSDPALREEVLALVQGSIAAWAGGDAPCFNPRHGLRAERGGVVVELLLCFECSALQVYLDGRFTAGATTTGDAVGRLNEIWRAAGGPPVD